MTTDTRRPTLSEQAYRAIKRRIICLDMAPGMPFTEAQLAVDLDLSKTPVREALSWLQRDGLVHVEARSRYTVAPITLKDVRDLFSLRVLLEGEAVAQAAGQMPDAAQIDELDHLCRATYDPYDHDSITDFLEVNTRFHVTVARLGGNKRLAAALERELRQMERLFHLSLAAIVRNEDNERSHTELIGAITRGDSDAAREMATAKTRASERMVIESLLSSDAILLTNITEVPAKFRQVPTGPSTQPPPSFTTAAHDGTQDA